MSKVRRDYDSLGLYLRDISGFSPLSREREVELARSIQNGEKGALDELVNANSSFVVNIAKKHINRGLSLQDLISEGNVGLVTAAMRYDGSRGYKFITYAVWWVRQTILKAIAENMRIARPPMNVVNDAKDMEKAINKLYGRLGRMPEIGEIANELEISEERVIDGLGVYSADYSFDVALSNDEEEGDSNFTLHDVIPSGDGYESVGEGTDSEHLMESLRVLNKRERYVVTRYFGLDGKEPYTLDQIGERIGGVTRERVRQIRVRALLKLRKYCERRGINMSSFF